MARSTLFIASSTASAEDKGRADYTCDGTADDVQIQAAITVLKAAGGGAVLLSPGSFKLNARIVIDGGGNVNNEQDIAIYGCGPSNTKLDATLSTLVSGVHLTGSCKVHLHGFQVEVGGATHGISSAGTLTSGADWRSFWHSSFKNLEIVGDWAASTGYGLYLGRRSGRCSRTSRSAAPATDSIFSPKTTTSTRATAHFSASSATWSGTVITPTGSRRRSPTAT